MTKRRGRKPESAPEPSGAGPRLNVRVWLTAILAVQLALGLLYWWYTPFGAPPDEGLHGKYIAALVSTRSLPVFDMSDRANYEAHQPPLYYALGVPFYLAGRAAGLDDPAAAVRLLSILLSAGCVLVTFETVRRLFPDEPYLALSAASFAALLPSHVMVGSSVSNDILSELVFGAALLGVVTLLRDGLSWRGTVSMGLVLGLGLLTKSTCAMLFPVAVLAYLFLGQRGKASWVDLSKHAAAMLAIGLAVGGWWLARNQALYGDPLAMSQFQQAFQHTAKPEWFMENGVSPAGYLWMVANWTFCSFWGVFGHMNVFMPAWTYQALGVMSAVAAVGCAVAIRRIDRGNHAVRDAVFVSGVTLALVAVSFLKFNLMFFQAQGRYLYPAMAPLALFWALGATAMVPASRRPLSFVPVLAVLAAAQAVALATCIIPRMPGYHL